MAPAVLGFIVSSAVLLACLIIVAARMTRARRSRAADCTPHGTGDGAWIPAYGDGAADCGSADAGAGCDGGGGD